MARCLLPEYAPAPGQHDSEVTSQRWRAVGVTTSDLPGPGIEPQTSRIDSYVLNPNPPASITLAARLAYCF